MTMASHTMMPPFTSLAHATPNRAQVYERTKAPLLTLMAGGSSETVYCILKHLEGMLPRCPGVFDDEYRQFFTR